MRGTKRGCLLALAIGGITFSAAFAGSYIVSDASNMQVKVGDMEVSIPEDSLAADVKSFLNIRYQPSSSSTVIGKLVQGDTVKYIEQTGDWTKIDVNGQIGYVYSKYAVTGSSLKKYIKKNYKKFPVTGIQTGASFEGVYKTKKAARADAAVYTMDGETKKNTTLYATKSTASTISNEYEDVEQAKVTAKALRLRKKPSTDSKILKVLSKNTCLTIVSDKKKDWWKVKYDGKVGYVSTDYVKKVTVKVNKSNIVKNVKKSTKYTVKEVTKGWVTVESEGVAYYIRRKDMKVAAQNGDKNASVVGYLENNVKCNVISVTKDVALVSLPGGGQGYMKCSELSGNVAIVGVKIDEEAVAKEEKKIEESVLSTGDVSETRKQLVEYAVQFVGNPYKWGGTSLTKGCDCSGFTQQVFKKFNVNLKRCSYEQVENGTEIEFTKLQAGDLLFYYNKDLKRIGHVALYIGDGKIVHAKCKKEGIVINDWNYNTPYKAVNVLGK